MLTPTLHTIVQSNHDEYRNYSEDMYQMRDLAGIHLAPVLLPPLIEIVKDYFFINSPFTSLALQGAVVEGRELQGIVREGQRLSRAAHYSQYAVMMLLPDAVARRHTRYCYQETALHVTPLGIPNDPCLVILPTELRLAETGEFIERRARGNYIVAATSNHTHTHLFLAHEHNGAMVCSVYELGAPRPNFVKTLTNNPVPYLDSDSVSISPSADAVVMLHAKSHAMTRLWFTVWDQASLTVITTLAMVDSGILNPVVALGPTSITIINRIAMFGTHISVRIDFGTPQTVDAGSVVAAS